MARTLRAAYGEGLLSEDTLMHRLDLLFGSRLIDPGRLIGDLTIRSPRPAWSSAIAHALRRLRWCRQTPRMLALDWAGGADELLIGRDPSCDVVLSDSSVSRRHARLKFRDGSWILQDLGSTNGTWVNDVRVGRCQLRAGDHLELAGEHLLVD